MMTSLTEDDSVKARNTQKLIELYDYWTSYWILITLQTNAEADRQSRERGRLGGRQAGKEGGREGRKRCNDIVLLWCFRNLSWEE